MENEEPEVLSVEVGEVIEKLLARQTAFEATVNEKIAATNRRLEDVFAMQQDALRDAAATLRAAIEGKRVWPRPSATQARSN